MSDVRAGRAFVKLPRFSRLGWKSAIAIWLVLPTIACVGLYRSARPTPIRRLEVLPGRSIAAVRPATPTQPVAMSPAPISIQWLGAVSKTSNGFRKGERCILTLDRETEDATSCVVTLACESGVPIDRRPATHCNAAETRVELPDFQLTEAIYRARFSSPRSDNILDEDLEMDAQTGQFRATKEDARGNVVRQIFVKLEPRSVPVLMPRWHPEVDVCDGVSGAPRFDSTSTFNGTIESVSGDTKLEVGAQCIYTLAPNRRLGLVEETSANCKATLQCGRIRVYEAIGQCGLNELSEPVDYVDPRPSALDNTPTLSVEASTLTVSDNTASGRFNASIGLDRDPCRPRDME